MVWTITCRNYNNNINDIIKHYHVFLLQKIDSENEIPKIVFDSTHINFYDLGGNFLI